MVNAYKGMAKGFFLTGPQEFAEGFWTIIKNYPSMVKKFADDPIGFYENIYNVITDGGTYTAMAQNVGDYVNELMNDPEKLGEAIGKGMFETYVAEKAVAKVFEKIGDVADPYKILKEKDIPTTLDDVDRTRQW